MSYNTCATHIHVSTNLQTHSFWEQMKVTHHPGLSDLVHSSKGWSRPAQYTAPVRSYILCWSSVIQQAFEMDHQLTTMPATLT